MAKGTTVTMFSRSNDTLANNVAAKESWGHKKRENLFINSFIGTGAGGVSYVNSKTRSTNDQQGAIINTGVVSDIAIDGAGMLVVSDSVNGEARYTRRGDFRQDELGFWKNGADQLLKAWKLDENGNLPQSSSLLSSLEAVNFANTKGVPVKTSVISIAMNLNANQKILRGSGVEGVMKPGLNSATNPEDILFPDRLNGSSINLGDTFTFTSTSPGVARSVTFGGMSISDRPGNGNNIFGANSATGDFTFQPAGTAAAPGVLLAGDQINITVSNGSTYTFTASPGIESAVNRTFKTMSGLASTINRIDSLKARIDTDGRLYIAPTKANQGLTIANGPGANIVQELGLGNVLEAGVGVERFNSLATLRDAVNKNQSTESLNASIEGRNIKITSLLATDQFQITGNSGPQPIKFAVSNPTGTEPGRATVNIRASNSKLLTGDYIKITGMGGQLPDGIYMVSYVDANGFNVHLINDVPMGNLAPLAPATQFVPATVNPVWERVPGASLNAAGVRHPVRAANVGAINVGPNTAVLAVAPGHGIVQHDVIYVSGGLFHLGGSDVTIPAGYYRATAVDGNNVTINVVDAAVAVVNVANGAGPMNVQKIGDAGGAALPLAATGTLNTQIMTTIGGAGSNQIKYYIGNGHGYRPDDKIVLSNLGGAQIIDNINFDEDTRYNVTSVGADFVVFEVDGEASTNGNETDFLEYTDFPGISTNNYSRLFEYFNIQQDKDSYEARYSPTNEDKNLSAELNGISNFPGEEIFSVPVGIFDSQGSEHTINLYFAKLSKADNLWTVEVVAGKNDNNTYDIENILTENGLLRSGTLKFEPDGTLSPGRIIGFDEPIKIQINGREENNIRIDWENILSDITSGTVTQHKNANNVEIIQSDGQPAGTLTRLEVDQQGFIIGTFDSGETRKLYKIPVAIFANVNGLIAGSNGTFEISRESGQLLLKSAGLGGAGRTLGGVLEASNVDITSELLRVQETSNTIRANARVAATEFKNLNTVLSELNQ